MKQFNFTVYALLLVALLSTNIFGQIKEKNLKSLPQTPPSNDILTDLEEKNLKGKVKAIFEKVQRLPDTKLESWGDDFFNKAGFLLKEISYIENYPDKTTVWGWIDGMRVSRENSIVYAQGKGPAKEGIFVLRESPPPNSHKPRQKDERYDIKYVNKFDKRGRVLEKLEYSNTGILFSSEKFSYPQNKREIIVRAGRDLMFIHRRVEEFNKNGDVVKITYTSEDGTDPSVEIYKYKYDSKQNWIKKEQFEQSVKDGKAILEPTYVHFREIIYYE